IMVCLFSGWIEAFPCCKADSLSVAKCLLNHIMPAKGIPATLSTDRGTHFTGQLVQHLDRILHIKHLLHCPYHPQSAGAVERRNGVLKNKLAKICDSTGLSWPVALPLALMDMRSTPSQRHTLSPFEIVMGRPMRAMTTITPVPDLNLTHSVVLQYCKGLMQAVSHFHSQVRVAWPTEPTSDACHNLEPGDWVYVRHHHRKHALEPRWKGPHQVLLTTQMAVKLSGIAAWIHVSQCKKAPSPENQSSPQDHTESILTPEEDVKEQSAIPYNLRSRKGCQKQTTNK
ncbi:Pr gag-pro-pol, partial [Chelydra serpentina]